ncbi:unnamed protein product [Schistosoma bovis]|nr:unnamed protein product [Schistosoma bovis]
MLYDMNAFYRFEEHFEVCMIETVDSIKKHAKYNSNFLPRGTHLDFISFCSYRTETEMHVVEMLLMFTSSTRMCLLQVLNVPYRDYKHTTHYGSPKTKNYTTSIPSHRAVKSDGIYVNCPFKPSQKPESSKHYNTRYQ